MSTTDVTTSDARPEHWAIDPHSESTGTAEAWRCDCEVGSNHVDDLDTCEKADCDDLIDGEPSWTLPDGDEVYLCSPHHNEPSQLAPEAVAQYWGKIAAGEPAKDAQAAAHAAHHEVMQQRRGEVAADVRHVAEVHHNDESCSDG
jgi:hypothetical protein